MPGNMDPLGQVAQILGVQKMSANRARELSAPTVEKPRRGDASLVNVSHSGSALADMASRLRAVGFVHNPGGADYHEHRPPPHHERRRGRTGDGGIDPDKPGRRLKRFAETDEHRAQRSSRQQELTQAEVEEIRRLKSLDGRVKAHEMAHKVAAGNLAAGGPYYEYEQGPDGVNYAVAGHVPIRVPETSDPEQALRDSEKAYRAALAPADPSASDRSAAAKFSSRATEAKQKIAKAKDEERAEGSDPSEDKTLMEPQAGDGSEASEEGKAIHANRHPEFLLGQTVPKTR